MKQLKQVKFITKKLLLVIGILMTGLCGKAQKVGDNLGNHIATQDIDMANHNIINGNNVVTNLVNANGIMIGTATFDAANVSLQLNDATKAFLVNRVADLTSIAVPVNGMLIYSNAQNRFYFRNNGAWETFASSPNGQSVLTITAGAVGASPNGTGLSLSTSTGDVILTLQPADGSNPGVVTAGTQTFGGNKTFSGPVTVSSGLLSIPGVTASSSLTDQVLVVDATGIVRTTTLTAGSIMKVAVAIPNGTSTLFTSPNMYISFTITVTGVLADDGVVVNFKQSDVTAFEGLTIKSGVASADNTVTIKLEDDRNPAAVGYGAPHIDGKNLIVTWLHKN